MKAEVKVDVIGSNKTPVFKSMQLMSDYDIYVEIFKMDPEKAKEIIMKKNKNRLC
jgi:hypothetical protein